MRGQDEHKCHKKDSSCSTTSCVWPKHRPMLAKKYMLRKASLAPTFSHSGTTSAVECRVQRCRRHRPVVKHSSAFEGFHCITSTDKPSREIVFSMEPKCSFVPHLQSELHDMFVQSSLPRPEIIPSTLWRKVQRAHVCLLSPWYRPAWKTQDESTTSCQQERIRLLQFRICRR